MKKSVIILIAILSIAIFSISFTNPDSFGIGWGSSDSGEITIGGGGGIAIPPTGDVPPAPPTPSEEEGEEDEGGSTPSTSGDFTLDKSFMAIKVKRGVPSQEKIDVTNNLNEVIQISISQQNLTNKVFTSEISLTLQPHEKKSVLINVYIPESERQNIITGKIDFRTSNTFKSVDLLLDIQDKAPLFDIKTTLLRKILVPGQTAVADVRILNLGDLKNIDVELESFILDSQNNIYDAKKEMFAINDSFDGKVLLKVPSNISFGKYKLSSTVRYRNVTANSYDSFDIIKSVISFSLLIFWIIILVLLTLITLIAIVLKNQFRNY